MGTVQRRQAAKVRPGVLGKTVEVTVDTAMSLVLMVSVVAFWLSTEALLASDRVERLPQSTTKARTVLRFGRYNTMGSQAEFTSLGQAGLAGIAEIAFPGPVCRYQAPRVDDIIRRLGAPAYQEREAATRELEGCSPVLLPLVEKAARHPDPEVKVRARQALTAIRKREYSTGGRSPLSRETIMKKVCEGALKSWPIDELRCFTRSYLGVLRGIEDVSDQNAARILAVFLASLRHSKDPHDHAALVDFINETGDVPAAIALRVAANGLLHELTGKKTKQWSTLPAGDFNERLPSFVDPARPAVCRALMSVGPSPELVVALRELRDSLRDKPGRNAELLPELERYLWSVASDEDAKEALFSSLNEPGRAPAALLSLYARLGTRLQADLADRDAELCPIALALRDVLFADPSHEAAGEALSDKKKADLYVWCGRTPGQASIQRSLSLTFRDSVDRNRRPEPITRVPETFGVVLFSGITPGNYEAKLQDGVSFVSDRLFARAGVNVALLPNMRPEEGAEYRHIDYMAGTADGTISLDFGPECPQEGLLSLSMTESGSQQKFGFPMFFSSTIALEGIPLSWYHVDARLYLGGFSMNLHKEQLRFRLPLKNPTPLQIPLRKVRGNIDGMGLLPPLESWRTTGRLIGFYSQIGKALIADPEAGYKGLAPEITAYAPVSPEGAFEALLVEGRWFAHMGSEEHKFDERIDVSDSMEPLAFELQPARKFNIRVKAVDEQTGLPLEGVGIEMLTPCVYTPGIGGGFNSAGRTDRDGVWERKNQPANPGYQLHGHKLGYMNSEPALFDLHGDQEVTLKLSPGGTTLTVHVTNKLTKEPVPKVDTFGLYYKPVAAPDYWAMLDYYHYDSDKKSITVEGLRPGRYYVRVWGYRDWMPDEFTIEPGKETKTFELVVEP